MFNLMLRLTGVASKAGHDRTHFIAQVEQTNPEAQETWKPTKLLVTAEPIVIQKPEHQRVLILDRAEIEPGTELQNYEGLGVVMVKIKGNFTTLELQPGDITILPLGDATSVTVWLENSDKPSFMSYLWLAK